MVTKSNLMNESSVKGGKGMKEEYKEMELEVIAFENEDVITDSTPQTDSNELPTIKIT